MLKSYMAHVVFAQNTMPCWSISYVVEALRALQEYFISTTVALTLMTGLVADPQPQKKGTGTTLNPANTVLPRPWNMFLGICNERSYWSVNWNQEDRGWKTS